MVERIRSVFHNCYENPELGKLPPPFIIHSSGAESNLLNVNNKTATPCWNFHKTAVKSAISANTLCKPSNRNASLIYRNDSFSNRNILLTLLQPTRLPSRQQISFTLLEGKFLTFEILSL